MHDRDEVVGRYVAWPRGSAPGDYTGAIQGLNVDRGVRATGSFSGLADVAAMELITRTNILTTHIPLL